MNKNKRTNTPIFRHKLVKIIKKNFTRIKASKI